MTRSRVGSTAQRDNVIRAAIRARKIPASAEEQYRRLWDADERSTQHVLTAAVADGGLLPGQVSLAPGEAPSDSPAQWFPETQSGTPAAAPPSHAPAPVASPAAPAQPAPRVATASGAPSGPAYPPDWLPETNRAKAPVGRVAGDGHGGSVGLG
jgi:hypothetical protein